MKRLILLLCLQLLCSNILASEGIKGFIKETHLYSVKGSDSLKLDRYYAISDPSSQELKPAIIFMFGGAFYRGVRDSEFFLPCFEYYVKKGYEVFSIDYRLGFKEAKAMSIKSVSKIISLVEHTINMGVEDLYDATSYIIHKSQEWSINPELIITFGSSSGAMCILQAEYYRINGHPLAYKLPTGFQYAGIISMSGAISSVSRRVRWKSKAAPVLMFQGSADENVPYNKKRIFKFGFYGSKSIARSLKKIKSPYYFVTVEGAGHEIAGLPMNDNRNDIDAFLTKLVKEKQPLEIIKISCNTLNSEVKERFTIKDYLNANFFPEDPDEYKLQ